MNEPGFVTRLRRSIEGGVTLSPGQAAARELIALRKRHTMLAGGTRSGKTTLIVCDMVGTALRAPNSRHAILRYRANAARSSISLDTLPTVMRKFYPGVTLTQHSLDSFFELPNGSQIFVGGLDEKERVKRLLGNEYLSLFFNEASQIPYASFEIALTRLAQTVPGEVQQCFVDLNPTATSHLTYQLFQLKRHPVTRRPLPNPEDYVSAFLNPRDNQANLSREYLASLESMPDRQRRRFYEGVYSDEQEGALFSIDQIERNRVDHHDVPEMKRIVIKSIRRFQTTKPRTKLG